MYNPKALVRYFYFSNHGRNRSIDLTFSRFRLGSRVEDLQGNIDNPVYQEFCNNATDDATGSLE